MQASKLILQQEVRSRRRHTLLDFGRQRVDQHSTWVWLPYFPLLPPQGLTENQNRLLYMVSLYTHKADTRGERDHWLRKPALVVLLYEGVVANVLDFDYAPQSELIENRRIWMNVSQV